MPAYRPDRGHFVYLNFTPQAGREQAGKRPALVLSPRRYNIRSRLVIACPVTSRQKGYPFEALIPDTAKIAGVVLCDQVRSLDWVERKAAFHSVAPDELIEEVVAKIAALIIDV